jgi:hypothetical protein
MLDSRQQIDLRERQKALLIKANCGDWESIFVRIGSSRIEIERFPCQLSVIEKSGLLRLSRHTRLNADSGRWALVSRPPVPHARVLDH